MVWWSKLTISASETMAKMTRGRTERPLSAPASLDGSVISVATVANPLRSPGRAGVLPSTAAYRSIQRTRRRTSAQPRGPDGQPLPARIEADAGQVGHHDVGVTVQ